MPKVTVKYSKLKETGKLKEPYTSFPAVSYAVRGYYGNINRGNYLHYAIPVTDSVPRIRFDSITN